MIYWLTAKAGAVLQGRRENHVYALFCAGAGVGGEDRDIHFDSMSMGQGATMALPIWAIFMKKVYADVSLGYSPEVKFDIPADYNPCYHVGSGGEQDDFEQVDAIDEVFE